MSIEDRRIRSLLFCCYPLHYRSREGKRHKPERVSFTQNVTVWMSPWRTFDKDQSCLFENWSHLENEATRRANKENLSTVSSADLSWSGFPAFQLELAAESRSSFKKCNQIKFNVSRKKILALGIFSFLGREVSNFFIVSLEILFSVNFGLNPVQKYPGSCLCKEAGSRKKKLARALHQVSFCHNFTSFEVVAHLWSSKQVRVKRSWWGQVFFSSKASRKQSQFVDLCRNGRNSCNDFLPLR